MEALGINGKQTGGDGCGNRKTKRRGGE